MAKAEASKVTEIGSTATGVKKRGLGGVFEKQKSLAHFSIPAKLVTSTDQ